MDAFSYLSVLLSIILGLAITQVLQGARGLLLSRRHVTAYWPTILWSGLILVMATQMWWASFGLAGHAEWTFAAFGIVLIQVTLLYMLAALVLPDFAVGEPHDLRAHYYREAKPFFGILLAMLVSSVLKDVLIDGHLPTAVNLAFHLVLGAMAVGGMVSRRPLLHEIQVLVVSVLTAAYITLLFARLH